MTSWPSEIPVTREGYKERPPRRVIRSDMDIGPDKIRRRSSSEIRPVSLTLFLTQEQLEIFDEFYLENDSFSFNFVNPRTSQTVSARFIEEPDYSLDETMFRVSVSLEILP